MREIKFRGKDLQYGEWIYGLLRNRFYDDSGMVYVETASEEERNRRMDKHLYADAVDPSTVGQYTGIKDRDGREIYEGDIVKSGWMRQSPTKLIVWDDYRWGYYGLADYAPKAHSAKEHEPHVFSLDCLDRENLRVIGNIFDNPELQKGGSPC